jgi:hypothetical protein
MHQLDEQFSIILQIFIFNTPEKYKCILHK